MTAKSRVTYNDVGLSGKAEPLTDLFDVVMLAAGEQVRSELAPPILSTTEPTTDLDAT